LLTGFGHVRSVPNRSVLPYGENALFTVRTENEGENFRNWVVEFPAGIRGFERTIGTRIKLLVDVARADFAPVLPCYLLAAWAFPRQVFPARATI
jgi:hypothetical protein